MKKVILSMLFLWFAGLSQARQITEDKAELVARNFYLEKTSLSNSNDPASIRFSLCYIARTNLQIPLYYAFNVKTGGFVVVSAQDNVMPILAYAFEGTFSKEPCNFSFWMKHYEEQIAYARSEQINPSPTIVREWQRLSSLSPEPDHPTPSTLSVSPLLVSHWNQDSYYNGQCPIDPLGPDGHCYAGCVATAMGQLMYYYRYPEVGAGSYSYVHPEYGIISAGFDTTQYNWNGMPSYINKANNPIANLLFHLGVSVDMDYGPDGSGMWNHKAAYSLKNYFRYGPETHYYFRDSTSLDWDSILIVNLNQRKPLYYAGWAGVGSNDGHAFVCDGYQDSSFFHFNWGWGGQSDGYFYLDNLTPSGSNFNFAQEVIPLFPDTLLNVYPVSCSSQQTLSGMQGSVEDGSGWTNYQPNSTCSWLINPPNQEFDSVKNIKLTFLKFDTEPLNDVVRIYDGDTVTSTLLGTFSGNSLPPVIISNGNKLLIVFETNGTDNRSGWIADYEAIPPVYCTGTTFLYDPSGTVEDGSGSKNYNNNSICKWKIQPPDAGAVTFVLTSFDLADSLDILRIFDQSTSELLAIYKGGQVPEPVTSFSGKMLLMFSTNKSNTAQGWEGEYTTSLVSVPGSTINCLTIKISSNPVNDFLNLQIYSPNYDNIDIGLFAQTGQCVFRKDLQLNQGANAFSINVSGFPPSVYILKTVSSIEETTDIVVIN